MTKETKCGCFYLLRSGIRGVSVYETLKPHLPGQGPCSIYEHVYVKRISFIHE